MKTRSQKEEITLEDQLGTDVKNELMHIAEENTQRTLKGRVQVWVRRHPRAWIAAGLAVGILVGRQLKRFS